MAPLGKLDFLDVCFDKESDADQGVPHRLMMDDEYDGYHLPAGALVVGNIW